MSANPFTLVYTGLWSLVESNSDLTDLVAVGNRIRYDTVANRNPEKRSAMTADYPELVLVSDGLTGNMHATSSSGFVIRNYSFYITTGDLRMTEVLLQVEWELWRALNNWKSVLPALEWNGIRFVKRCNINTITNGTIRAEDRTEGPLGWVAIWSLEVEMHFPTASIAVG